MKVKIYTLGCKVNTYESEFMESILKEAGYEITEDEFSDIYIINTCTVTNNSDKKSKKMINHYRKQNKEAIIVACGCYIESNKKNINEEFEADIVIGNNGKSNIIKYIEEFIKDKKKIIKIDNIMDVPFENMMINSTLNKTRAFIKIQDGCCNYCSYCIIPFVRGKCRSKSKEQVIEEINSLIKLGYKEIVLTGIHTGNYGKDIDTTFSNLLEEILNIDGLFRIRISSIEITELDDKFFKLLENEKICNHLHIPLQSGCDITLKDMNRKYDTNKYKEIVNRIRKVRPNISITTDVIVGFPTETEENFNSSLEFIKSICFSKVHVFPFSKRDNTKASFMENIVSDTLKKERTRKLLKANSLLEIDYRNKCIGMSEKVLIETYDNKDSFGHTSNYLYVKINGKYEQNSIIPIIINKNMF